MFHPRKGVCVSLLSAETRRTLLGDPSEPWSLEHHVPVQEETSEPPLPRHQPQRGGPRRMHSLCRVRVALALTGSCSFVPWEGKEFYLCVSSGTVLISMRVFNLLIFNVFLL